MRFEILEWDSKFFGMRIARILDENLTICEMSKIISELQREKIRLAYWSAAQEFQFNLIRNVKTLLADRKTTFVIDLRRMDINEIMRSNIVESFTDSTSVSDLESLAIQSGDYSRFRIDPDFPTEKFVLLYKLWISRSIRKEIASDILLIRGYQKIAGMLTIGEKNGRGEIGLFAIDRCYRGRKYGENLVRAAQEWFVRNRYEFGQVVTQGANIPACNLYKKCGYSIEKVEYMYHIWL